MLRWIASACLLVALLGGCGKAPPSSSTPVTDDSAVDPAKPPVDSNPSESLPNSGQGEDTHPTALLAELTQAVRRYGVEQRRVPKTLDDLVSEGYLEQVPQPPDGKRFAINKNLEVYLIDQ